MASGPHTGWERAILIWTLALIPIVYLSYIFGFADNALDTREKFLAFFLRPKVVESDVTRLALNASEQVLEINKELSRMEARGKEAFGRSHSWQIPNFKPGETIQTLTEEQRLMHPDFVTELSRRSAILGEREEQIIFEYGHLRLFYAETIIKAKGLSRTMQAPDSKCQCQSLARQRN